MGEAAEISRVIFFSGWRKSVFWYALLLQLPIQAPAALHPKYTPVVDVSVYSDVSGINSSTQAQFVPMFGAPGDINNSQDGSTIRLRLEIHSGKGTRDRTYVTYYRLSTHEAPRNLSLLCYCNLNIPLNFASLNLTRPAYAPGSGIASQNSVFRGFFNAAIKLPCGAGGDSSGIVSAFYTSNGGNYPSNHDEIDMEFLGVRYGQPYVVQTNIYADGSTRIGREERFHLWFDPTVDFHNYSILWTYHHIVFFIDDIPIRRYVNRPELGIQYPTKPMNAYATIWDGSTWATEGGQYHVNYTQGPFDATFMNIKLEGCVWNPTKQITPPECALPTYKAWFNNNEMQEMSDKQMIALEWARSNFMWYSYCNDKQRYPLDAPPECPRKQGSGGGSGNLNSIVTSGTPPSARKGPWRKTPKSKPVTKSKPTTLAPVPAHKQKKRNKPSKFEAFHYLPYSLWQTKSEVKLLKEDMEN